MKYLRKFNESDERIKRPSVRGRKKRIHDYIDDIKDIVLEIQDMGYTVDINTSIQYHIEPSKSLDGIAITVDADPYDYFYLRGKEGNIKDCILRLNDYAKSIGCGVHIDPENKSKEFLTVKRFIEDWSGEELTMIDIIIYEK